jgi:hypothetical protein
VGTRDGRWGRGTVLDGTRGQGDGETGGKDKETRGGETRRKDKETRGMGDTETNNGVEATPDRVTSSFKMSSPADARGPLARLQNPVRGC